jgi:hypothetical protein
VFQTGVQDADPLVGQLPRGLAVVFAAGLEFVAVGVGAGDHLIEQTAHWSKASAKRLLRLRRACTTRERPEVFVTCDVPA